jgi:hypothetical protein
MLHESGTFVRFTQTGAALFAKEHLGAYCSVLGGH